ncbi:uncharacterized protein [Chelonus insularis]|uniref:uncharacterized protein n=1 Tax=Chelonus insularis TaxID=460826 RepID=UPI0015894A44|nr:uncharacterized protein LOC118066660 [Chelonus insularis]
MIPNRWRVLLFFVLLEIFCFTYQSHTDKELSSSHPHDRKKFHVQKKNSQALNNFLEDVLMAKDELKWIDQMIYPQARRHKSHETRRRLLSEKRVGSKKKKKHRNGNKNYIKRTNSVDNGGQRKEALKKIKNNVIVKKSIPPAKRHYFTPNVHGFGVIEYYDYDESSNKRKISDKKSDKHSSMIVKKKATKNPVLRKKKLEDKNREYKIPQELVSNQENLHSAKLKYARNTLEQKNNIEKVETVDGLENSLNSVADVNGREARCHRDRDDDAVDDFKSQRDFNYQKNARMTDDDYHLAQNIYDDDFDPFFLEVGNTSSSGSDYQALKATDDLFKGGMEQGNSNDDNIPPADYYNQKKLFHHWKTDSHYKTKKKSLIESQPYSHYVTAHERAEEIYQKPMSNSALSSSVNVRKSKKSKEKRSNIISGPILRHESIVEPLNWPWEYYDDKDESKIRFGRGLMQVSEENNDDKTSFSFNSHENEVKQSENRFDQFLLASESEHIKQKYRSKRNEETPNANDDFLANFTVNGKLTDDIVNKIFEEVEASNTLNTGLRPGLSRKTNLEDHAPAKCSSEEHEQEVNRTSTILKQVGKLLNHLVAQKMQKKMCLRLSPHQRDFLIWITDDAADKYARPNPQHLILHEKPSENLARLLNQEKSRYLFGHLQRPIKHSRVNSKLESSGKDSLDDELKLKTRLLKRLIKQYESLSESEQIKVEDIHKHLRRQLNLLQKYARHRKFKKYSNTSVSKKSHQYAKKYPNSSSDFSVNKKGSLMSSSINKIKNRRDLRTEEKIKRNKTKSIDNKGKKSLEQFNSSSSLMSLSDDSSEDGNHEKELRHSSSSACKPRSKCDRWIEVFENITTDNILSPSNQSSVKSIEIFSTISSTSSPLAAFSHNSVSDENGSNEKEENLGEQLRDAKDLESKINVFPVNNNKYGEE